MKSLILPPRFSPDSIALRGAAIEANWHVERLQSWRVSDSLKTEDVAIYGESLFCAVVADQLSLFLLEPPFQWLAEIPKEYRLRDVTFCNLAEAKGFREQAFFKPADDKCFAAKVYDNGASLPVPEVLPDDTPVLISEPVEWNAEFRFFVLNGEIQTFSPYSRNGELIQDVNGDWLASEEETEQAVSLCRGLLENFASSLPPSVVVDVGEIVGRGWAVVEANPCFASGIYGCDASKVLQVIERASVRKLTAKDERWFIQRGA